MGDRYLLDPPETRNNMTKEDLVKTTEGVIEFLRSPAAKEVNVDVELNQLLFNYCNLLADLKGWKKITWRQDFSDE